MDEHPTGSGPPTGPQGAPGTGPRPDPVSVPVSGTGAGGRGRSRIAAEDVGSRVVVRHLLPDGRASDALGELLELSADRVVVRRADGEDVVVAAVDVVAARPVPPAPPRRAPRPPAEEALPGAPTTDPSVEEVARGAAATWPAHRTAHLGGWELRSSPGRPSRGWSAVATGDPGCGTDAALEAVTAFADQRGLPAAVTVASALPGSAADDGGRAAALEAALTARGWRPGPWAVVATAPADLVIDRTLPPGSASGGAAPAAGARVAVAGAADAPWWAASDRDGSGPLTPDDLPPVGPGDRFLTARAPADGEEGDGGDGGAVLGVARVGLAVREGRTWAGLSCVHVRPDARRAGVARALAAASARVAAAADPAAVLFVQVLGTNAPARATWRSLGFVDHHRYRSWRAPDGARDPARP